MATSSAPTGQVTGTTPPRKRGPKPKGLGTKHLYVRLPADLERELEELATDRSCAYVDVVRTAVAHYLADHGKEKGPRGSTQSP